MRDSPSIALAEVLRVMARLRSRKGCPWDRQQTHRSLRFHAVEEVYELMDAIEAGDDREMLEELGDLLLQIVFHCQLARERGAFHFADVCRHLTEKLVRRHPHVFGTARIKTIEALWAQWDKIKTSEKAGTRHERHSALDGIPRHLPALLRAEKLVRKARKAGLMPPAAKAKKAAPARPANAKAALARQLFRLAATAQAHGWSAEALLRDITRKTEAAWRRQEKRHRSPARPTSS